MNWSVLGRYVWTLMVALTGAILFRLLHIPLAWMLGPMFATLLASNIAPRRIAWSGGLRNTGLAIVGYMVGLSLTAAELKRMAEHFPLMLAMTLLLLLTAAAIAWGTSRALGLDLSTTLLANTPGGLSQVLKMAEETPNANLTFITFNQVIRVLLIVVCVPLLVFSPLVGKEEHLPATPLAQTLSADAWAPLWPYGLLFAAVCLLSARIGLRVRLPTAYMLGPTLGTALVQLLGLEGPALPAALMQAAQLMIGIHIGMMLKPEQLGQGWKSLAVALASGALLLSISLGMSAWLAHLYGISFVTALLCLAPGGLDQMSLIAQEIDADVSLVVSYQLFRIFFILFVVTPLLQWLLRSSALRKRERAASPPQANRTS